MRTPPAGYIAKASEQCQPGTAPSEVERDSLIFKVFPLGLSFSAWEMGVVVWISGIPQLFHSRAIPLLSPVSAEGKQRPWQALCRTQEVAGPGLGKPPQCRR